MAVDIGSTKIVIMVGQIVDGQKTILIQHAVKSRGVVRGAVENIDDTIKSIKSCLDVVKKQMAARGIAFDAVRKVNVGIAGAHIGSMPNTNTRVLSHRTKITEKDVEIMTAQMSSMALRPGQQILHVIPQNYRVDGNFVACDNIVGYTGSKIDANYHIVTADTEAIGRIQHCIEQCGLQVNNMIMEPLASADAVLSSEEMQVGVALIDIGGGTSDCVIYADNTILTTHVLPCGGEYVTNDIAKVCHITHDHAEILKVKYGACYYSSDMKDKKWVYPASKEQEEPHEISMATLSQIIQARMKDIIDVIQFRIDESSCDINKIVFTGGGAALQALSQYVAYITGCEVRIGTPYIRIEGKTSKQSKHPMYATCIGLLFADQYSQRQRQRSFWDKINSFLEEKKKYVVSKVFEELPNDLE